ncbi:MAG: hypothetical protein AUG88_01610 [Actinobacteria bacterium 13_1_20CM_4_68_12]|nr:MAG: hypothetical protein AUG88_01610 [Actinobacteria bacterium 13_1_20CM_4_68_12]
MSESAAASRSLYPVVAPVCAVGLATVVAATVSFVTAAHGATVLAGLAAFLAASLLADRFPVPVDDLDANGVSLAFVFGLSAIVLFGWAAGVLVVAATPAVMQLLDRRPPVRIAYNSFAFALTAASAGLVIAPIAGDSPARTAARVLVATCVCYLVNVLLITAVVARGTRRSWGGLIASSVRKTILPFTLIRHFHERLARELEHALRCGRPLALCLVDIDDFKRVNDHFGHPAGDRVLSQVATRLRQSGEAFRLGGDEFAVLLPGSEDGQALTAANSIVERISRLDFGQLGPVTVSAGIALAPQHARQRDELLHLVDTALYRAKEEGKNRAEVYRPDVVELAELKRLAGAQDRAARLRAAASLANAVDARDVYSGNHSQRVAELAVRLAARIGLSREEIELTQLAGSLHDLGKLALPENLLRKPAPLTEPEWSVLKEHASLGSRMLESLGIGSVAEWVLHHHERWDGTGYPDGLAGTEIPLGARILFVADAYDAMTSGGLYGKACSPNDAMSELVLCAGTQFDPSVVEALAAELDQAAPAADAQLHQAIAV